MKLQILLEFNYFISLKLLSSLVKRGIFYCCSVYILCHDIIKITCHSHNIIIENPATHQKYTSTHFTQSQGVSGNSIRSVQILTHFYKRCRNRKKWRSMYVRILTNNQCPVQPRRKGVSLLNGKLQTFPSLHTFIIRCTRGELIKSLHSIKSK